MSKHPKNISGKLGRYYFREIIANMEKARKLFLMGSPAYRGYYLEAKRKQRQFESMFGG